VIGWLVVVQETVMNLHQCLMQVSCASFWYKLLERVLPALDAQFDYLICFVLLWEADATRSRTCASHLVQETCMCVRQSSTSFFWYKFLACTWAQLYSRTETVRHLTRTVQCDWAESCFGARNCDELASNFVASFLCKFLAHVSGTSFFEHVLSAW